MNNSLRYIQLGAIVILLSAYQCNDDVVIGSKGTTTSSSSSSSGSSGDTGTDTDGDGLFDDVEEVVGTDPSKADTDHDGFADGLEYVSENGDPLNGNDTPDAQSKAKNLTEPSVAITVDADRDGLGNGFEDTNSLNSNAADSDGDGYADGLELVANSDPLDEESRPTRDAPPASDGVVRTGTPPTDSDGDGLSDTAESSVGASAELADSDSDGFADGIEFLMGSSRSSDLSVPNFSFVPPTGVSKINDGSSEDDGSGTGDTGDETAGEESASESD